MYSAASGVTISRCSDAIKSLLDQDGGKTLCEVFTVADTMPPPMTSPRVDGNLSLHGSVRLSLQRGSNRPRVGHLASWIRHMVEKPNTNTGRSFHYRTIVR